MLGEIFMLHNEMNAFSLYVEDHAVKPDQYSIEDHIRISLNKLLSEHEIHHLYSQLHTNVPTSVST